jgi:hypothetical protein
MWSHSPNHRYRVENWPKKSTRISPGNLEMGE